MLQQHSFATTDQTTQPAWLTESWRLASWYLFLARRRLMTLIMLIIFVVGYLLIIGITVLIYTVSTKVAADAISSTLTFPGTLTMITGYLGLLGPILLAILAAGLVGSEYGYGIQRQLLSRGMGRAQVMTAQLVAMAIIALVMAAFTLLLGALVGVILGPILGISIHALSASGWLGLILFWLTNSLRLFVYMLIAVFLATLGRSIVSGLAFTLGIILLEGVLTTVLSFVAFDFRGKQLGDIINQIANWFPSNSSTTINNAASQVMLSSGRSIAAATLWQAIAAVAIYCVVLIAGSYLIYCSRDSVE